MDSGRIFSANGIDFVTTFTGFPPVCVSLTGEVFEIDDDWNVLVLVDGEECTSFVSLVFFTFFFALPGGDAVALVLFVLKILNERLFVLSFVGSSLLQFKKMQRFTCTSIVSFAKYLQQIGHSASEDVSFLFPSIV